MSLFLRAARREPVDVTPVWFMRQAGRSLPEYRKLRERWSLADIVAEPDLCAEVTLQPVRRLGVDAAVMFADIMLPLRGMGVDFDLVEDVGPVIADPIASQADVERLREPAGEEAAPQVIAALARVVADSPVPVICFSGAPFTLASYLIEGRPSRGFDRVKAFMYREPEAFDLLLGKLARVMSGYLAAQVAAGAQAVQLFDSWVGTLTLEDYEARVAPHTRSIFDALSSTGVPRVHFGTDTAHLLQAIARTGPDIVSVDWRVQLDDAWSRVGVEKGVQGNLEPALLLGPPELVAARARDVLRRAGGRPGHIFNLGHGVPPGASVENLQLLVETVHSWVPARVV
ncbi:MAG TPA: uroporphyrinogen decarboxylase [Candidatus Dormibacteraeota bacterium]|nr:uroporphyrinogen decarboxylase [Candidatus Dormibacteraeota bacterium]